MSSHDGSALSASSSDVEAVGLDVAPEHDTFHQAVQTNGGADALFRALAPGGLAKRSDYLCERRKSVSDMLALSQAAARPEKMERSSLLITAKDDLARQFLAARRMAGNRRGWAKSWALQHHADRCRGPEALQMFLQNVRRYARDLQKQGQRQGVDTPGSTSQGLRRWGGVLGVGVCTTALPQSKRRRRQGAGGPGTVKCPEIGAEMFAWFVDSIKNVRGRLPSFILLDVARALSQDMRQWHAQQQEAGEIAPHVKLDLPVLDHSWLRRWRRMHHISWRTVNLRFKCSRAVLKSRLHIFWTNILRVRFLHLLLEPGGELVFEGMDQKPLWFTASSQEKTLAVKGARKVCVKENVPMTRARFTAMTRCRWPTPPQDGRDLAVLFKAAGGGSRIREGLRVPQGVLLQFAEKGSYRLQNVLEYLEWILDRSRAAGTFAQDIAPGGLEPSEALSRVVSSEVFNVHAACHSQRADVEPRAEMPADSFAEQQGRDDAVVAENASGGVSDAGFEPSVRHDSLAERPPLEVFGRRVVYLLDWFAPHLDSKVDDLIHSVGHAVVRIGGHLTPLVQVEDTHAHGPYSAKYKKCETEDAYQQLLVRPDRLPSTSRQTVLDRAQLAWSQVNHGSCTRGFVEDGITNALDGSEDGQLTADVIAFWTELDMPRERLRVHEEVREAVRSRRITRFEEYRQLLQSYDDHAALQEGQEAFGVRVDEKGAAEQDSGSATEEGQPVEFAAEDSDFGDQGQHGRASLASSHEPMGGGQASPRLDVSLVGASGQKEEITKVRASQTLVIQVKAKTEATMAALQAAQTLGGDAQLVETLQQRLHVLSKERSAACGSARIHLRSKQLERKDEIGRRRQESTTQEARTKELALTVKLRQAEAEVAKARGKEVAAAAKKAVEEARLRAKEEALLQEQIREKENALRLRFAAFLVVQLNEYLREGEVGRERKRRAGRLASHAARRRVGLKCMPVPRFWPTTTQGLRVVSSASAKRLNSKQEVLWASPDFAWMMFGREQQKHDDARHSFRKLVDRLMPDYFVVLSARYDVEGLLAESHRVFDLAFVAANWRYTQIVGAEYYRKGLHVWPPEKGWDASSSTLALSQEGSAGSKDVSGAAGKDGGHADSSLALSHDPAVVEWTVGTDGLPVRTEDGMRLFLSNHGLRVMPSLTHGVNNCLIDSVLQSLHHAGMLQADLSVQCRKTVCRDTRAYLVDNHGCSLLAYLAHDQALPWIFDFLRSQRPTLFVDEGLAERLAVTVTVLDRFSCRAELEECEAVLLPAISSENKVELQIQLYACTHADGVGYHYEWVRGERVDPS